MEKDYDAVLRNAQIIYNQSYTGYIYEDSKGRWPDGTMVTTSKIVTVKDGILQTLNTRYKLEN